MHLDVYQEALHPDLPASGRPDLVGSDASGRWYVVEAKGRSNALQRQVVAKAKEQTRKLRTVCGRSPSIRIASVAYFSHGNRDLALRLADPVGYHRDAIAWDFVDNQFLRDYYKPFVDLFDGADSTIPTELNSAVRPDDIDGEDMMVARLPDVDLEIGLARSVYEVVSSESLTRDELNAVLDVGQTTIGEPRLPQSRILEDVPGSGDWTFHGADGIYVRLGPQWFDDAEAKLQGQQW